MSAPPTRRPTLIIATTNSGKFREFSELLGGLPVVLRSLAEFPAAPVIAEHGDTYGANALHKALTIARWQRCAALADDSGLEVDALGGAPGVYSARYAGGHADDRANIDKLLVALAGVPPAARTARFVCVLAVARADGKTLVREGACAGRILETPRGQEGFGYDPLFFHPPSGVTFAEMPAVLKNRVSHRARACAALRPDLVDFLAVLPAASPQ